MSSLRRSDKLKLGTAFHPNGNHIAAWLHPAAQPDAATSFAEHLKMASIAERGKFDFLFVIDFVATRDGDLKALSRSPQYMNFLDPLTLCTALAAVTTHLGLVATATTSYNEPYNIARRLASMDHISGGRVGWNIVTSSTAAEAHNFGRDEHFGHAERYERAAEFVEVVKGLFDSWDDDAFVMDRASSLYFKPDALHVLDHKGPHFSVRGPLHVARPPQGHPVFVLASASPAGTELAAKTADVIFTPLHDLERAQGIYRQIKAMAVQNGRGEDAVKIMPGLNVVVGRSEDEARQKHAALQALIHPDVGREMLSTYWGMDLSPYKDGDLLPDDVAQGLIQRDSRRFAHFFKERLTIREMYLKFAAAHGQRMIVGSVAQVADEMEHWFMERAADGFLIMPALVPGGLEDFVALVVPELQKRGVFRRDYEGLTLRDNLGVSRPESRYAPAAAEGRRRREA